MKSELKIGNLVDFNGTISTVLELRENHARIEYVRSDTGMRYSTLVEYYRLEGVLITEGWLVKLGLKKVNDHGYVVQINPITFLIIEFDISQITAQLMDTDQSVVLLNNIKHVHELQNLYFALSTIELNQSNHEPQS